MDLQSLSESFRRHLRFVQDTDPGWCFVQALLREAPRLTKSLCAQPCRALNDFEKALFSPEFTSPTVGWRAYGNETTFADWWLAAELIKNAKHSYHGADYLTKVHRRVENF